MKAPAYRVTNAANKVDSLLETIKANIVNRRKSLGWSQRQFAAAAKVSQRWVSLMESTPEPLSLAMLCRVADALGTTALALQQPGTFGHARNGKAAS